MSLKSKNITMDIKKSTDSDPSNEYETDSETGSDIDSETGSDIDSGIDSEKELCEFDSYCSGEYDTYFEMNIVNKDLDYYDLQKNLMCGGFKLKRLKKLATKIYKSPAARMI